MDARHASTGVDALTLPRRRFTVADVFAMQDAGVLQDGQVELLAGELVTMAAKKNDHEIVKRRLGRWLQSRLPLDLAVAIEATLYLSDHDAPEPDIMVHSDALLPESVRGGDVLLLVEIAVESLTQDLGAKAAIYARHGIQTYWVIDAARRQVHVHGGAQAETGTWSQVECLPAHQALSVPGTVHQVSLIDLLG